MLDGYGGGWCFMVGGHAHWWRPWSPYFVVAGPWFYWHGPYDAYFWSYWPYYATYYSHYYPRYYGGGSWRRGAAYGRTRLDRGAAHRARGRSTSARDEGNAGADDRGRRHRNGRGPLSRSRALDLDRGAS